MGLSASKRVHNTLQASPEFDIACDSVFQECLNLTQHAFNGVRPYQLSDASLRLYQKLSTVHPLVKKWVTSPPTQNQVDRAFNTVIRRSTDSRDGETLDAAEFKAFAVELFREIIVSNAGKAILQRVPVGIAGIAGMGIATRSGRDLVGTVMGFYAVGVATAVYISLSG